MARNDEDIQKIDSMASAHLNDEAAVAAADKEMEERANRAKELLSKRYHGLKRQQVRPRTRVSLIGSVVLLLIALDHFLLLSSFFRKTSITAKCN